MNDAQNPWLKIKNTNLSPKVRLFCIPFAGAGASAFTGWQKHLNADIELISVQLPGRENRFSEPALSNMSELLRELEKVIFPYTTQPWAIFGHSMGAAIGYQLVNQLIEHGFTPPVRLFVSAKTPPHLSTNAQFIAELPDKELIQALSNRYGADISGGQQELLELMLPTLRADFTLVEGTFGAVNTPLPCPITAFNGSNDHSVSADKMSQWCKYTANTFEQVEINGPHFYLQSAVQDLAKTINQRLE